jgi:hypothetical protein
MSSAKIPKSNAFVGEQSYSNLKMGCTFEKMEQQVE